MSNPWFFRAWITILMVLMTSSCTNIKYFFVDPVPPKATLKEVKVTSADFKKIVLNAQLVIHNPNDFDINAENAQYEVLIKNKNIAQGFYKQTIMVPSNSSTRLELPISIQTLPFIDVLGRYLQGHQIELRLKGSLTFLSPVGPLDLNFDKTHKLKK